MISANNKINKEIKKKDWIIVGEFISKINNNHIIKINYAELYLFIKTF